MGSHLSYGCGWSVAHCGCTSACGFESSTKAIMTMHSIEPWSSKDQIIEHLQLQEQLARHTPLKNILVQDGLNHFSNKSQNWMGGMTEEVFKRTAIGLMNAKNVPHTPDEDDQLHTIFQAMDYDENGRLSIGEWAGGMTVFFKGNREECIHAVFTTLDADGNGVLSRSELGAYLQPFVKAMVPTEAAPLRPLLIKKCTEEIFEEMAHENIAHLVEDDNCITSEQMIAWMNEGHNIIDRLVQVIDPLVYKIWMSQKTKQSNWGSGSHHSNDPVSNNMSSAHRDSVFGGGHPAEQNGQDGSHASGWANH